MLTSPSPTKKIRWCFFFSLAFVIVIPITCTLLGVTLHPTEFQYSANDPITDGSTRKISLHANLITADLKQGTVVLDWSIAGDNCVSKCPVVNIYFATNLLHSDTSSNGPSGNNRPVDPIFVWNVTAYYNDTYSNFPTFQTELVVFPLYDYTKHPVRHTRSSQVYYPFDRYYAKILGFAEDASSNATVPLSLGSTSGLAVGLKISADVANTSYLAQEGIPEFIGVIVTLQRGTLVIWYCLVINITFWLITLTICLVMIMTVGFGFQQRNEIVVIPVGTVFAFTQLRSTMPGAPDGFGDILGMSNVIQCHVMKQLQMLDFVGVLPCLVLLSICAVTMIGIYVFTDPANDCRERLTWPALGELVIDDF
ncbi:uncharacterized protein ARMOST_20191 [Armillaria ostoyae]|uniref:Uncharacterized protein n=1 Tax=Armillaria ostoyae TaxID=47428 RepID=A0A284S6N0_ARMOS|nr:uncharacterized protein ARMOST_20191 [Armillaria ostoyae]